MLPDDIVGSITSTLQALANALSDNSDAQSLDAIAHELQYLRDPLTTRRPQHRQPMMHDTVRRGPLWQL